MKILTQEEVHASVWEAFKDVKKGQGIGVREATAHDDYASEDETAKARAEDVENWWEIPEQWKGALAEAFSFTDQEGMKYILPAAMYAVLDETKRDGDIAHSILFSFCLRNQANGEEMPGIGDRAMKAYMERISPQETARHFGFTGEQVHALALYFLWWMQSNKEYFFEEQKEKRLDIIQQLNTMYRQHGENYQRTVEDDVAIDQEKYRIMQDWLILGGVNLEEYR